MKKITIEEAKKKFGERFHNHPNVLSSGHGDINNFLQKLEKILHFYWLKLSVIEDGKSGICVAIERNDIKAYYKIAVSWTETGEVLIAGDNPEDALENAKRTSDGIALPEGEYLDDSFQIDEDETRLLHRKSL